MSKNNYIAFMCHCPKGYDGNKLFNELEETLLEYDIKGYVISMETDPYIHYHFLVEMQEAEYIKYRKRVFIDKLKLSGKATKNQARQYGKVKEINDFQKMLSYTVKDENIKSNMDDEFLNDAIDRSFKKEGPKLLKDKLTKYIDDQSKDDYGNFSYFSKKKILLRIVKFNLENKIPMTKSLINSYYLYYRQFTNNPKNRIEPEDYLREILGEYEYSNL